MISFYAGHQPARHTPARPSGEGLRSAPARASPDAPFLGFHGAASFLLGKGFPSPVRERAAPGPSSAGLPYLVVSASRTPTPASAAAHTTCAHDSCLKSPCIAHVPDKGPAGSPRPREKAGSACWQRGGRGSAEGRDWQKPPELRDV